MELQGVEPTCSHMLVNKVIHINIYKAKEGINGIIVSKRKKKCLLLIMIKEEDKKKTEIRGVNERIKGIPLPTKYDFKVEISCQLTLMLSAHGGAFHFSCL